MRISILFLALIALFYEDASAQRLFKGECCEEYCYSADTVRPQTKHYTSRSAYQLSKGTEYKDQSVIPNCTPVKFWILNRHGTRLPDADIISSFDNLESIRDKVVKYYKAENTIPTTGGLCAEDLKLIKKWVVNTNITVDYSEFLTDQGWNDLKILAQDYQKVFPDLIKSQYNTKDFLFRHTDTQRTEASYKAFVEGWFGEGAYKNIVLPKISGPDTLLAPFGSCPLWDEQDATKKDPGTEIYEFKYSVLMNQTISDISTRLGYDTPLKYSRVKLIWDMCRFEAAWFLDKPSPWCAALTFDQAKVLEYMDDLTRQSKYGYVSTLNQNMACEVIQDMLNRLNSDSGPQVTAYFSHSALIQLFAVGLGIMRDNPMLKSTNYDSMGNRKWRISKLDPFAANFAAIKYDCSANLADPSPKVKFFLNQSPMELDGCINGLCKLSDLMSKYAKYLSADCPKTFCV